MERIAVARTAMRPAIVVVLESNDESIMTAWDKRKLVWVDNQGLILDSCCFALLSRWFRQHTPPFGQMEDDESKKTTQREQRNGKKIFLFWRIVCVFFCFCQMA